MGVFILKMTIKKNYEEPSPALLESISTQKLHTIKCCSSLVEGIKMLLLLVLSPLLLELVRSIMHKQEGDLNSKLNVYIVFHAQKRF